MKKYKLPKILKLDLNIWRCGQGKGCKNSKKHLGRGGTNLLNNEGYYCCLGLFCKQAGLNDKDILFKGCPEDTKILIDGLTVKYSDTIPTILDSSLSVECLTINDDKKTTIKEKIQLLRDALTKNGFKLKVLGVKKFKEKGLL